MNKAEKLEALLATARAFYDRGGWLQYDQLSLDREVQVSPRRWVFAPPEMASPHTPLFLDCSAFAWDCYFQAFDYQLEADLTWNILDHATPCMFACTLTHRETPEELEELRQKLRDTLEPGDIVTFQTQTGGGHSMLVYDAERYINCTQLHGFNGYNYEENRNVFHPDGGVCYEPLSNYFSPCGEPTPGRHYLFGENIRRFAVHRPLDLVGDPTPDALARLGEARDLIFWVENSFPGGRTAAPGEEIRYTLYMKNPTAAARSVRLRFVPGRGSEGTAETAVLTAAPGAAASISFTARALSGYPFAAPPQITAGGLRIASRQVLIGRNFTSSETELLLSAARTALSGGTAVYPAVRRACETLGIRLPEDPARYLRRLFFFHDSRAAEVLSRKEQLPETDGCVYSYFGGRRVITTEAPCFAGFRTTTILLRDLQPGDFLLLSPDLFFEKAHVMLWTGDSFIGRPEWDTPLQQLTGEAAAAYLETLFGRYVFALIRPSLKERNS